MVAGLMIAAISLGIVVWVISAAQDIVPPDTSDLELDCREVPESDNACSVWLLIPNALQLPDQFSALVKETSSEDMPSLDLGELLNDNARVFEMIREGLARPMCQIPRAESIDSEMPYLSPWLNASHLLTLKIRDHRSWGEQEAALDTALMQIEFTDRITRNAEGLISFLLGSTMLREGLAQTRNIIQSGDCSPQQLRSVLGVLSAPTPTITGLQRAIKVEYRCLQASIVDLVLHAIQLAPDPDSQAAKRLGWLTRRSYLFQPNRTLRELADLYRTMMANASKPLSQIIPLEELGAFKAVNEHRFMTVLQPNAVGKLLVTLLTPAADNILIRKCQTEADRSATTIIAYLHLYHQQFHDLPATLVELDQVGLRMVPIDPFDGQPFRYKRGSKMIYSVGSNLTDEGGSTESMEAPASCDTVDLVYSLGTMLDP
ncbi:MAG: hypothetical protein KDL31_03225 [Kiritimatiellae bacterium]|nr:hypothetical protein [Kiritimatiellia bacterium]